ncbi:MAG: hypothetical protein WA830_03425 [Candidatus Sulfotelmatobacter sp.]
MGSLKYQCFIASPATNDVHADGPVPKRAAKDAEIALYCVLRRSTD